MPHRRRLLRLVAGNPAPAVNRDQQGPRPLPVRLPKIEHVPLMRPVRNVRVGRRQRRRIGSDDGQRGSHHADKDETRFHTHLRKAGVGKSRRLVRSLSSHIAGTASTSDRESGIGVISIESHAETTSPSTKSWVPRPTALRGRANPFDVRVALVNGAPGAATNPRDETFVRTENGGNFARREHRLTQV